MSILRLLRGGGRALANAQRDNVVGMGVGGIGGAYAAHEQGVDDPMALLIAAGLGAGAGGGAGVLAGPMLRSAGRGLQRGARDAMLDVQQPDYVLNRMTRRGSQGGPDPQQLQALLPQLEQQLRMMQQQGGDPRAIQELQQTIAEVQMLTRGGGMQGGMPGGIGGGY